MGMESSRGKGDAAEEKGESRAAKTIENFKTDKQPNKTMKILSE